MKLLYVSLTSTEYIYINFITFLITREMSLNEVLIFHSAVTQPQVLSKSLTELNLSGIQEQGE